tara:strand:+ start:231 stop:1637 length:1407 start_codon:yes stop_codon:yes gene_type:complete
MAIIQYKGNFYDTNDPQQNAELLRLQRAENIKKAQSALSPNVTISPQKRMEAANLLAQNQAMKNANAGVMTAAPTVENIMMNKQPVVNTTTLGLLNLPPAPSANLQLNQQTQSLLNNQVNSSPTQPAQPQPKRTLGQRASGLFDRVSDAYMSAAPIFAVAQEFQKAGALRPIGSPMQGDPYGKMMEVQQTRQQSENLANLRQDPQYAQFANLPTEQFLQAVEQQNKFVIENQLAAPNTYANIDTNVSSENLMEQLNETKKPIVLSDYELRSHGNAEMAHGIENTAALIAGSISVPFTSRNLAKKTEEARAATVDYFNEVRGILVDNVGGRVTVFDKKAVNNQLPAEFNADGSISSYSSEGEALAKYQGLRGALTGQLKDAIALTQDPNTRDDKTVMRKANSKIDKLRRAIRMTDVRIDSLNQERRGEDAFFGEREDLFENPIDTSGYSGMTEEQAEEIFFSDLDVTFE